MRPNALCLWFDRNAEEAARFYIKIFPKSRITSITHYGDDYGDLMPPKSMLPAGTVLVVDFELNGQPYMALNGGPMFTFNEAASIVVFCKTQRQLDRYWHALIADGGQASQCGWLKDKFGLSWQIVPEQQQDWMSLGDSKATNRMMQAMLPMQKLDIAKLKAAFRGTQTR